MNQILIKTLTLTVFFGAFLTARAAVTSDYKIQPEDVLSVFVFEEPDLTLDVKVQGSGSITYPLLDTVQVAGKTAKQVQDTVKLLLAKDFLVNPQVTVNVKQYSEQTFSVHDQVRIPGIYKLPAEKKYDVIEAIASAGGLTPNASGKIVVFRQGKKHRFKFDDLLEHRTDKKGKRFYIEPGDIVRVSERFW